MEKEQVIDLVKALQNGDDDAVTELYNAFSKDIYYHILKTVNDKTLAEDLLQETFIEIIRSIDSLNDPGAFLAWSKQIAFRRCTAYFKKTHDVTVDENEDGFTIFDTLEDEDTDFIPDSALEKADMKRLLHDMIDELPEDQRSALMMRYFEEKSVKEIAEIQGVSEGTVKSRLNYARKALKDAIESYEEKNDTTISFNSASIIPLLLWLFRDMSAAAGAAGAAGAGGAAGAAGAEAARVVAVEGAKAVGKFAAKKIIAGVAAAAIAVGGITAAVVLSGEDYPILYSGYLEESEFVTRRVEITVEDMDKNSIEGRLEMSSFYSTDNAVNFTGERADTDEGVVYTISFDEAFSVGTTMKFEQETLNLHYDKKTDTFSLPQFYDGSIGRADEQKPTLLAENTVWSGLGDDDFYNAFRSEDHLFELDIEKMTDMDIVGTLTVSYEGNVDHKTAFTGRGYRHDNEVSYEVKLETPRSEEYLWGTATVDVFWLTYDTESETFSTSFSNLYNFEIGKK